MQKSDTDFTLIEHDEGLSGTGIFYRLYGKENSGPPLVMIMGYGGCMFTWPPDFVEKLARQSRVLLFDHRGTGRSSNLAPGIDLRIRHFADDLKNLISELGFEQVNLFGYSMGGCVSLEFARLHPQLVNKLVLQSTTAGGPLYASADQDVKERMANPRGRNFDEMLFDFFDLCMPPESLEKNMDILRRICERARPYPTPLKVLLPQAQAFRNFDASSYLAEITKKTLLFHGKHDRILKIANGQNLAAKLSHCRAIYFEDCGHCPHIEHQELVLEETLKFVACH